MRLLVVRHAIAEDRETFAQTHPDDAARPLTDDGRKKMKRVARGLKQLVPDIDLLAASSLIRAIQTAEIIARRYDGLKVQQVAELVPGTPLDSVFAWLAGLPAKGTAAVVGHEPDLSAMVCALLTSADGPFLEFRKGGACLLDFQGPVGRGAATLDWFLGPKHLQQLGDG
jgi:phosphohistidine phosphatase